MNSIHTFQELSLIQFKKIDGTSILINPHLISAIVDNKDSLRIMVGAEWFDFKISFKEFVDRVNKATE